MIPAAALAAVLILSSPASAPSAERAECLCLLESALVAATDARDRLEAAKVSDWCGPSRGEELIYLNHLIPGFRGWLDSQSRRPPADYDLASIIRRARIHRERGRARLR